MRLKQVGWMVGEWVWYANGANSLAHFAWLNATFVLFYFLLFLAMKVFFFKWIIVSLISNYCCSCCWWVFFFSLHRVFFLLRDNSCLAEKGNEMLREHINFSRSDTAFIDRIQRFHARSQFVSAANCNRAARFVSLFIRFISCVCVRAHRSLYQHRSTLFLFLSV